MYNLTAVHVHHFLHYKLSRAVDIFQNLCRLVAIWAVDIFLSKSETARIQNPVDPQRLTGFEQLTKKVTFARMVSSSWKIVSSSFFEQSNFEQLIMSRLDFLPKKFNVIAKMPFLIAYLLKIYFFQGQKSEIFIIFGLFFVKCTYLIPWLTNKHSIKNFFPPKNTGTNNTLQVTAKKPFCQTDNFCWRR
jgi:hypothetical protein